MINVVYDNTPLMTTAEVAAILNVDPDTVTNEVRRRRLSATRVGRLIRIHPSDLEAYIAKNSTIQRRR